MARPLMLKDFLREDPNTCSTDFCSFQTRSDTTVRKLLEIDLNAGDLNDTRRLQRSRSKAVASTTISAFQKASEAVKNVVKQLPFSSVKSPSYSVPKRGILQRSFSQRLKRSFLRKNDREELQQRGRVRVLDIVRWRSFAEDEENKQSFDFAFSTSITTTTPTTSSSSSWSESDFVRSSSGSSVYSGENEGYDGKRHPMEKSLSRQRCGVGEDSTETANCCGERKEVEGKGELGSPYEEKEQLSPVSVLDFPYEDEETLSLSSSSSSFQESLANMEKTKQRLLQKIRRFESLAELDPVDLENRIAQSEPEEEEDDDYTEGEAEEEKAMDLLDQFKASYGEIQKRNFDGILLDFFREGLSFREISGELELEEELLKTASNWMNGLGPVCWTLDDNKELHIKEMEKGGKWRKFEEEVGELTVQLEVGVLGSLIHELLLDLLC